MSETSKTCATREDDTSDPTRFSCKFRDSRANNEMRFTCHSDEIRGGLCQRSAY
jgi:hypothetical protein